MPYVVCPTCGERGKITSNLIGVRIKCRKCGVSFLVSPPTAKAVGAGAVAAAGVASTGPGPGRPVGGRRDPRDRGRGAGRLDLGRSYRHRAPIPTDIAPHRGPQERGGDARRRGAAPSTRPRPRRSNPRREYKLLTSRDRYFDGKFDLARMEEALNHFGRLGWVAKSMVIPHLKGYSGALEEVIVVLLERCPEPA